MTFNFIAHNQILWFLTFLIFILGKLHKGGISSRYTAIAVTKSLINCSKRIVHSLVNSSTVDC